MAKAVIEATSTLARHNETRRFQQLRSQSLHLLKMGQQTIPLIRCVAELKRVLSREAESPNVTEVRASLQAALSQKLAAEPASSQSRGALQFLPS